MVFIYQILNKINNKSYIGITNNFSKRMKEHKTAALKYPINYALKKYNHNDFLFLVLECTNDLKLAHEKEKHYIKKLNTKAPDGYNLTDGGEGCCGIKSWNKGKTGIYSKEIIKNISKSLKEYYKNNDNSFKNKTHSEKSKKEISESCKRAMTPERRKQISDNQIGKKRGARSEETKRKISIAQKGKFVSDQTREKISKALKGKMTKEDNGFYGKHHTEETKQIISNIHKGNKYNAGRKFTDEHKLKLSEAKKGNKNRLGGIKYFEKIKQRGEIYHGNSLQ